MVLATSDKYTIRCKSNQA